MNPDTGKVYVGLAALFAAADRGESLVPISSRAGARITRGRELQLRDLKRKRRARTRDRLAKASRKANR